MRCTRAKTTLVEVEFTEWCPRRAYVSSEVHLPRTSTARGKDFFEQRDPKELRSAQPRKKRGERNSPRPCGHSLAQSPIRSLLPPALSSYIVSKTTRGEGMREEDRRSLPVCLERPFKTPLRPSMILARSRGTLLTVEGTYMNWKRVRTDYSTWHVDPEATREEEGRLQCRETDACRACETRVRDWRIAIPARTSAQTNLCVQCVFRVLTNSTARQQCYVLNVLQ